MTNLQPLSENYKYPTVLKRFRHLLPVLALAITLLAASCSSDGDKRLPVDELARLDDELHNADNYDRQKASLIASLNSKLDATDPADHIGRWKLYMDLGREYLSFCSDSSAYFYNKANRTATAMANDSLSCISRIACINAWGAAGLFTQAQLTLAELDTMALPQTLRLEHSKAGRQLFSYMKAYAKGYEDMMSYLNGEYSRYMASLLHDLPPDNALHTFLSAQHEREQGHPKMAEKILKKLIPTLKENSNIYGMATYEMSEVYHDLGHDTERGRYLALAAAADVRSSTKETLALPSLARWLYDKGEVDRAYRYINTSLEDAMRGNARMRMLEIAALLPLIDGAYRKKMASSRDELMIYLILVAVLLIVSGTLLSIALRNVQRTRQANRKLEWQTKMQESYIGHFLGLCSSYSERFESLRRFVSRKIASGQTDDLLKTLKSGKFTDPENDDFFKIFDETFLDLYPDFIDNFNQLLRPECRITLKKGAPLSTELRIYAFVRLGVEESVKIAQILHCSVSTIYTYRNRMRGRAINRDTFEQDVMRL